jgi:hypothetical protein
VGPGLEDRRELQLLTTNELKELWVEACRAGRPILTSSLRELRPWKLNWTGAKRVCRSIWSRRSSQSLRARGRLGKEIPCTLEASEGGA